MEKDLKSLAVLLKQGNGDAFCELFKLYHTKIYFFCRHYHLCKEEAEEIVQETFMKLWLKREDIDVSCNIQSFIYTIAKNQILNAFKRKIYQKAAHEYLSSQQSYYQMEQDIICNDLKKILDKAINGLPRKRKEIFNLSRNKGLSNKEIAEKLDISIKTVETQMRLSLQHLRQVFRESNETLISVSFIIFSIGSF